MKLSTRFWKLTAIILVTLVMGLFAMPDNWKEHIPNAWLKEKLLAKQANFGLDLVGGRQIDYLVDLSEVNRLNTDSDPDNDRNINDVINNIIGILRQRIDPQGTRELNIYSSQFGDETHILVEITSDLENQATFDALSKVIDLSFKEQGAEETSETKLAELKKAAEDFLAETTPENFVDRAKLLANGETTEFKADAKYWVDTLENAYDEKTAAEILKAEVGTFFPKVIERQSNVIAPGPDGQLGIQQIQEFVILQVQGKETAERTKTNPGEDFEKVRAEVSEKDMPATQKLLEVPEAFQSSLLALNPDDVSDVLESDTQFAFFKILQPENSEDLETTVSGVYLLKDAPDAKTKIDAARERVNSTETKTQEEQITLAELSYRIDPTNWKDTELGGFQFKRARVGQDPNTGRPLVEVQFNDEGARLFEEITGRNVGKPIAIFVGGVLVSAPNVNEKISGGSAVITLGTANYADAQKQAIELAKQLNGGSTPAPFVEKGQFKIGASLGTTGLQKSLKAGMIGLGILALWMIVVYRFMGFVAVLALGFYAVFIVFLLKANFSFGMATFVGGVVFAVAIKSFSAFEKNEFISLLIALLLGIMATVIANSSIVLTLAGVAGIVLSIGMAVDANILIFERVREEIRDGKNFSAATAIGFERAWSSIRDSNLSSLITCAILWIFGSAVIKGFAASLAMGIVISMISAVTVTRTLISTIISGKLAKMKGLLLPTTKE